MISPEELRLSPAFAALRDAAFAVETEGGRIVFWNQAAARLFGLPEGDALGAPLELLVPPRMRARFAEAGLGPLVQRELPFRMAGYHAAGREMNVEISFSALDTKHALAIAREASGAGDETDELLTWEQAARAEAETLAAQRAAILQQISEGLVITDADGRITFVNEAARRMHGVESLGASYREYVRVCRPMSASGDPFPPEELPLLVAIQRREPVAEAEWHIRRNDGSEVITVARAAPIVAADGTYLGAVMAMRDVTEQRALERERGGFLAAVSHDLKSPLAAISGQAQLLQRRIERLGLDDGPAMISRLVRIDETTYRMSRLIDDLLDVARMQMGRPLELNRQEIDLVALVREAVNHLQPMSSRHQLHVEAPEDSIPAVLDALRVGRVVDNLVLNAIKYSPDGGEIVIRVARDDAEPLDWALLQVKDPGIGIPAADLPRVFERFHRASNVAGKIRGTGIGLAGSKQIIEQHGGTISVESREGAGSTFTARLPLTYPDGTRVDASQPRRRASDRRLIG